MWQNTFKFCACRLRECYLVCVKKRPFDTIFFFVQFELFGTNKKLIKRVSVRRHHWTLMVYARVRSATMNSNYMFECESIRFYVLKWIFFCVVVAIGLLLRSQSISCSWCMTALCLRAIWYLVCWVFIHYSNLTIFFVLEFVIYHFVVRSSSVYGEYSVGKLVIFSNGWHNNHRVQSNAYAVFESVAGNSEMRRETSKPFGESVPTKFHWNDLRFRFLSTCEQDQIDISNSLNTLIKTPEVNGAHFHGNKNELGNHFITFYYFNNEMDGMNHHPHKHLSLDAAFIIWCDSFNGILMCLV